MTRWIATFGLLLTAFTGCSIADSLANAPCDSDDDCVGDYSCVRTQHQIITGEAGLCRDDGQCAAGSQEGCITAGGSCSGFTLTVVTDDSTGQTYCCDTNGSPDVSLANFSADGRSAQCVACPSDLCSMQMDATEACLDGDPRCEVVDQASGCGCRIPSEDIENSDCEDDSTCGDGFVCTRTLEQQAEPEEALMEEQAAEDGWCRPTDAPECVQGSQEGCRTEDSCLSELERQCTTEGRCYCCDDPTDGNNFSVHVYAEAGTAGTSAACIQCPKGGCETNTACTSLEDATCVVTSGVCGCIPPA